MICHVRWHEARYFIVNLIHIHKFYQYELDAQQPHQVCVINILIFFLFEHKLFSFDLLSNISLSYIMIGYMDVIYRGLDTFNFAYIS